MGEKGCSKLTLLNTTQKASKDVWLGPAGSLECTLNRTVDNTEGMNMGIAAQKVINT